MGPRERFRVSEIRRVSETEIAGVLYGELPTKSNQRQMFKTRSGRRFVAKSEKAMAFVDRVKTTAAYSRIREPLIGATSVQDVKKGLRPLVLSAVVYGESWQRDLDVELLPDALQAAGVIGNDRSLREKHYWWRHDPANPRIEFTVKVQEEREA